MRFGRRISTATTPRCKTSPGIHGAAQPARPSQAVAASAEHRSTHRGTSTFAGAASAILEGFYCRDHIAFTFVGEQAASARRSYGGFKEAAREAGRSRIYGGIHFQFSIERGYETVKRSAERSFAL